MEGAELIVKHLKELIESMGGKPQGYKRELQEQLIRMTLPARLVEEALANIRAKQAKKADREEIDSQFSEVLSQILTGRKEMHKISRI